MKSSPNFSSEFYGGDDAKKDPFAVVQKWIDVARELGEDEVDAMDLATVDADGMPNIRIVYLRGIDDGFTFFTNYNGQKGAELAHGKVAFNMYFAKQQRQIRVRGLVEKVSPEVSDAYFFGRPEGSRLGAWVSQQSQPLTSRQQMMDEWEAMDTAQADKRPPHWGGYKITPIEIEFWAMGEFRLHNRFRWTRDGEIWNVQRLYP